MVSLVAPGNHRKELTAESHTVGSAPPADIIVHASMGIAAQHYRVSRATSGWQIEHLASNGVTSVNGLPLLSSATLKHGDQISAGELVLVFEDPASTAEMTTPLGVSETAPTAPAPAPAPAEALTGLAGAVARAQTAAKENEGRAKRFPKPAILAAAATLLLCAGGLAAWKFGLFGKGDPGAIRTAAPARTSPSNASHFDIVSDFEPGGSNIAITADGKSMLAAYEKWQPNLPGSIPALAEIESKATEMIGIKLTSLERVSVIGNMDEFVSANSKEMGDGALVVWSFSPGTDVTALLEKLELTRMGTEGDLYALDAGGTKRGTVRTWGGRHLLMGSVSTLKKATGGEHAKGLVQSLQSQGGTVAIAVEVDEKTMARLQQSAPTEQPLPKQFVASFDLSKGIALDIDLSYADAQQAGDAHRLGMAGLEKLTSSFNGATGQDKLAAALLARIESECRGATQKVSMRVTDGEIRMAINEAGNAVAARKHRDRAHHHAQILTSVCASALAAGTSQLDDAPDAKTAAKRLLKGIVGDESSSFATTEFKVPPLSDEELDAALTHLKWDAASRMLQYAPAEAPAARAGNPAKAAMALFSRMMTSKPQGSKSHLDVAKAKRNAQNIVSVFGASQAAGTTSFEGLTSAEAVCRRLVEGVRGGEGTGFEKTNFTVPMTDNDLRAALEHISWNGDSARLSYTPKQPRPDHPQHPDHPEQPDRFGATAAKRHAQNLASVFASANATGAGSLAEIDDVQSAIDLLCDGVKGGGGFDSMVFKVDPLDTQQRIAATKYLVWDTEKGGLLYADNKTED